jgi:hypothetical protein
LGVKPALKRTADTSETIETPAAPADAPVSACSVAVDRCMAAYKNAYRACATLGEADYKRLNAGTMPTGSPCPAPSQ